MYGGSPGRETASVWTHRTGSRYKLVNQNSGGLTSSLRGLESKAEKVQDYTHRFKSSSVMGIKESFNIKLLNNENPKPLLEQVLDQQRSVMKSELTVRAKKNLQVQNKNV